MKNFLIAFIVGCVECVSVMTCLSSCDALVQMYNDPDIVIHPPGPVVDPCSDPVEYIHPDFVTMDMEITDATFGDRIFCAGPYCDTISINEIDQMTDIVHTVMDQYHPEYTYEVYVYPTDSRRLAIIINGTNDVNLWKQKVLMKYNGLRHYLGWAKQGFIFSGALTDAQYDEVIDKYWSVNTFNFRLTSYDSTSYTKKARKMLCGRLGRDWADFRFNPYEMTDSIVQAFEDAGWNTVLSFAASPDARHLSPRDWNYADLRNRCIDWADVQKLLDQGYQVIINPDYVMGLP